MPRFETFKKLLDPNSDRSAKIAAGLLGWAASACMAMYSAWTGRGLSGSAELFMILSCALLGIDVLESVLNSAIARYRGDQDCERG